MLTDLIEMNIEIINSFNLSHIGLKGCIIKETKNMIYVLNLEKKIKSFEKKLIVFRTEKNIIDGSRIKNIYGRFSLYNI